MTTAAAVAPIGAHQLLIFLIQLGLLLVLALLLGRLATALRLPAVVGELCVGVLLGPTLLGHVAPGVSAWLLPTNPDQFHLLDAVGQFGLVGLVGVTGIEVDLRMVWRQRTAALRVGGAGLLIPFGLGLGAGLLLPAELLAKTGDRLVFAMFLGVALCVSAIPVIAKTLADMHLLHRNIGQLTLAAGTVDDVFGWLMLSVVAAMATGGVRAGAIGFSVLWLAVVVVVAITVGRPLVRMVLCRLGRCRDAGPSVVGAVIIVTLCAAATQALGFEAAFGAFLGGVLIGSSGAVDLAKLAPLRVVVMAVFAPLFFATVGLRIDLSVLGQPLVLVTAAAVLAVAVVGKFTGAGLGALASRLNGWESLAIGAGMNARGVIQIVVATVGLQLGVLTTATYTIVILVAIVTSLMTAPILGFAMRRVEQTAEEELRHREHAVFLGQTGDNRP
ncbi:cation:proton antiporter [Kutzneria sp. CA-103260]|uniref:cation:proton antiporter n=1 Tax=Kutzneria sp. CA-103260 TaxID=2802641 RepID=UPI001BA5B657|nr:cation:proton antiporter [Kutzneria sp. CA-103260]QUQ65309.1 cation/H(+) antiporter [Kutzneria sp. CA-103260]